MSYRHLFVKGIIFDLLLINTNNMNRLILSVVIWFYLALCPLIAKVWNPDTLPVSPNSEHPTYVSNPDGILSQEGIAEIDTMLLSIEKSKGVKALVIAVTNIEGDDPYRFATDVGNKYGVGTKDNTGIVIVLATDDRSYWISTGSGMEKYLPDAICKRIELRVMVPRLKEGKWEEALVETVRTITQLLEGDEELRASYTEEGDDFEWWILTIPVGIIGSAVGVGIYEEYKKKKCKKCGKHKMKVIKRTTTNISRRMERITEVWLCEECGHTETRIRESQRADFYDGSSRGGGGTIIGGGGGFHRSGPSFGSFGGGSFSGGGAGGRF